MDKVIKAEKKKIDKGMDKLVRMDIKRDKKCNTALKKRK